MIDAKTEANELSVWYNHCDIPTVVAVLDSILKTECK